MRKKETKNVLKIKRDTPNEKTQKKTEKKAEKRKNTEK